MVNTDSESASHWEYVDFDLEIGEQRESRRYPVSVRSPEGEAQVVMRFPFDEWELKDKLRDVEFALLRSGGSRRRIGTPEEQTVQAFGRALFETLITGDVDAHYRVSWREARRQNKGLRVKVHVRPPELSSLPWEFVYDPKHGYLCLSSRTPLVRYPDVPHPIERLTVTPPLRILGMVASPQGLPQLDVGHEKRLVEEAVRGLQARRLVELAWLEGQTWRDLQRAMRHGPWHIFHFIGHGGFDPETEEGAIALSDDEGRKHLLGASDLALLLDDHYFLRLVFLNSCEGARGSPRDPFSSTAATLVRAGIPAVVAMQYEITDRSAIEFSRSFYDAVADGLPIDAAVAEARTAVKMKSILEWGTPVLYMRSSDGRIFDVLASGAESLPETEDRQEENSLRRYREGVASAWVDGDLQDFEVERLRDLANNELGLDPGTAADIEREVMGDTIDTILERQDAAAKEEERNARLEELYARARELHQNQEWRAVVTVFAQIQAEDPAYPDHEGLLGSARRAVEAQERTQRVATLYDRGQRHMKAEEWQQALECFEEIQRLVPGYRETGELLARVRQELTSPPKVEVPDLRGQTLSQARSSLASKDLEISVVEEGPSHTIAQGEIIEQSPAPETEMLAGSSVSVTVSSGPHEITATAHPGDQTPEDTYRPVQAQSPLPALTGSWWAMVLRGLVIVIFGLLLPRNDFPGTFRLYGALMAFADGAVATIDAKTRADRRGPLIIQSRISFLVGFLVGLVWLVREVLPDQDPLLPVLNEFFKNYSVAPSLVGIWAIIMGSIRIIAALQLRWETTNTRLMVLSGVSLAVFGILFLLQFLPPFPDEIPWWLLKPLALVSGIALIAVALRVRNP